MELEVTNKNKKIERTLHLEILKPPTKHLLEKEEKQTEMRAGFSK